MMTLSTISRMGKWVMISVVVILAGCEKEAEKAEGPKVEPDQKQVAVSKPPVDAEKPVVQPEPVKTAEPEPVKVVEPVKPVVEPEPVKVVEVEKPAPKADAVKITLKFTADDVDTYKVITDADKSVSWEGPDGSKPAAFTGGHTGTRTEVVFTQKIKSVDDKGNATAEITIKSLKYIQKVKDAVAMDFDSENDNHAAKPLAKLIGASYMIELSPAGQMVKIVDATAARTKVADKTAQAMVSEAAVKERHSIAALDTGDATDFSAGDKWSNVRTLDFGMMGGKAYERIYTLKGVSDINDAKVAQAKMTAVPSAAKAEELHEQQGAGIFSKMFDNTDTYSGDLQLDLDSGKVLHYVDKLYSEWLAVDPQAAADKQPDALKMTALRLYQIDKID